MVRPRENRAQQLAGGATEQEDLSLQDYARLRAGCIRSGGGNPPPGDTPITSE